MKKLWSGLVVVILVIVTITLTGRLSIQPSISGSTTDDTEKDEVEHVDSQSADSQGAMPEATNVTAGQFSSRLLRYDANGVPHDEQVADRLVPLRPNEIVEIELHPDLRAAAEPIVLSVDHGGIINNQPLSPRVELAASMSRFSFQAGVPRGKYTVRIQQGAESEVLEFWVGAPQVYGRPGPSRVFIGPMSTSGGGQP